jgi:hypothetical protein
VLRQLAPVLATRQHSAAHASASFKILLPHLFPDLATPWPACLPCLPLQEIRRVWLGMLSQCDAGLGQKLAAKLQAKAAL